MFKRYWQSLNGHYISLIIFIFDNDERQQESLTLTKMAISVQLSLHDFEINSWKRK